MVINTIEALLYSSFFVTIVMDIVTVVMISLSLSRVTFRRKWLRIWFGNVCHVHVKCCGVDDASRTQWMERCVDRIEYNCTIQILLANSLRYYSILWTA